MMNLRTKKAKLILAIIAIVLVIAMIVPFLTSVAF